ncbi:MAG: hypothetical protein V7K77_15345 [Nostoc sp.]|uniref:hypothetical protein n=1 Tax=Nostoc sp. TaxID=1180 RepID=UPI002FFAE992
MTQAHINMPELQDTLDKGCLQVDGKIIKLGGNLVIIKAIVELIWYLPAITKRFGIAESQSILFG